jgi:hypothetical protein
MYTSTLNKGLKAPTPVIYSCINNNIKFLEIVREVNKKE